MTQKFAKYISTVPKIRSDDQKDRIPVPQPLLAAVCPIRDYLSLSDSMRVEVALTFVLARMHVRMTDG